MKFLENGLSIKQRSFPKTRIGGFTLVRIDRKKRLLCLNISSLAWKQIHRIIGKRIADHFDTAQWLRDSGNIGVKMKKICRFLMREYKKGSHVCGVFFDIPNDFFFRYEQSKNELAIFCEFEYSLAGISATAISIRASGYSIFTLIYFSYVQSHNDFQ